jgi:hypothetical protein
LWYLQQQVWQALAASCHWRRWQLHEVKLQLMVQVQVLLLPLHAAPWVVASASVEGVRQGLVVGAVVVLPCHAYPCLVVVASLVLQQLEAQLH